MVELGAGLRRGLTSALASRAPGRLVAVERDRDSGARALAELFAAEIAEGRLAGRGSRRQGRERDRAARGRAPRPYVLAGNLPYQISGPLLEAAVNMAGEVERVIFLLQLEVVDRLIAAAKQRALRRAVGVRAGGVRGRSRALVIGRGAFYPQPEVDSAVVVLTPRATRVAETAT